MLVAVWFGSVIVTVPVKAVFVSLPSSFQALPFFSSLPWSVIAPVVLKVWLVQVPRRPGQ